MNTTIYEINTMVWLSELSERYATKIDLSCIPEKEWKKIKDFGFDYVWMMGIWKRSKIGKDIAFKHTGLKKEYDLALKDWKEADIVGSAYSISAYEPDPLIGTWQGLKTLRQKLNKLNIKLVLDFIPNHTGLDHPWINSHPDYYVQGTEKDFNGNPAAFYVVPNKKKKIYIARGKDPYFSPWTDTAQLNYFNPSFRKAMIEQLQQIAIYCDGLRCDMAMLEMNEIFNKTWGSINNKKPLKKEFWSEARKALPDIILIAESYWDTEWPLQQLGFDYTYDKTLYDRLKTASPADINLHLKTDLEFQKKMVRFLENHDEFRSAQIFNKDKLSALMVLFSTLPGMKLYYNGQLEGKKLRIPVQLKRANNEQPDYALKMYYSKLLSITEQDIFHKGQWKLKEISPIYDSSSQNLIAYTWKLNKNLKLVVINLGQDLSQGKIKLNGIIKDNKKYILSDELNEQRYTRDGYEMINSGLHIILNAYKAHIFDLSSIEVKKL